MAGSPDPPCPLTGTSSLLVPQVLNEYFHNVCELDLVFNFYKVSCFFPTQGERDRILLDVEGDKEATGSKGLARAECSKEWQALPQGGMRWQLPGASAPGRGGGGGCCVGFSSTWRPEAVGTALTPVLRLRFPPVAGAEPALPHGLPGTAENRLSRAAADTPVVLCPLCWSVGGHLLSELLKRSAVIFFRGGGPGPREPPSGELRLPCRCTRWWTRCSSPARSGRPARRRS